MPISDDKLHDKTTPTLTSRLTIANLLSRSYHYPFSADAYQLPRSGLAVTVTDQRGALGTISRSTSGVVGSRTSSGSSSGTGSAGRSLGGSLKKKTKEEAEEGKVGEGSGVISQQKQDDERDNETSEEPAMPVGGTKTTRPAPGSPSPNPPPHDNTSSFPGTLSSALSWTRQRWNTASSSLSNRNPLGSPTSGNSPRLARPKDQKSGSPSPSSSPHRSSRRSGARGGSQLLSLSLPPLSLEGYHAATATHLMTPELAEEIRKLIPSRLQLHDTWTLAYSLEQHGVSLSTLYARCAMKQFQKGGFVLVVKDDAGGLFGAYVNERFKVHGGYYGTGQCFLWKAGWVTPHQAYGNGHCTVTGGGRVGEKNSSGEGVGEGIWVEGGVGSGVGNGSAANDEEDTVSTAPEKENERNRGSLGLSGKDENSKTETPQSTVSNTTVRMALGGATASSTLPLQQQHQQRKTLKFKAFPYSSVNQYFILCEQNFLSVGGGDGKFGLWLDDNFEKGVSSPCPTFGNEPLSDEGEKFDIIGVEVWSIGASV